MLYAAILVLTVNSGLHTLFYESSECLLSLSNSLLYFCVRWEVVVNGKLDIGELVGKNLAHSRRW